IQSFNHSIIQSFNHSIIQTFKQRYCYNFYKNPLKNPLLFIVPLSINPHHIFKPFDSISPIFTSVGLTELNS
ncbi:hypothetical protein MMN20_07635, partial [Helicobacter pylori]